MIVEGEATVAAQGREIATLGPGDAVGELALLDGGPRTATVIADTPIDLLVIGQREFAGLLDEVPGLAHKVMLNLADRMVELDELAFSRPLGRRHRAPPVTVAVRHRARE